MSFTNKLSLLQRTVNTLQEELADYRRMLATQPPPPSPPAPTPTPPKVKVKKEPDSFDGDVTKAKTFRRQLFVVFTTRPANFTDNQAKILYALSFMRDGNVEAWANHQIDQIIGKLNSPAPTNHFASFAAFMTEFNAHFLEKDEKAKVQHAIAHLRQGALTCDEFIAKFEAIEHLTDYDEKALISFFKLRCNRPLIDQIYHMERLPTTLAEWKKSAALFDNRHRQRELEFK